MGSKILVVGGGTYQVPLIRRIRELGHQAYCVDKNPEAPGFAAADGCRCADIMDREACLRYAKELGIHGVATYGATITLPTVSYIGQAMGLPALPMDTAELAASKYKIKKALVEHGCNSRGCLEEFRSLSEAEKACLDIPCVVKPSDGSGSKGVTVVQTRQQLLPALRYAFDSARFGEVYAEGFVPGEEYSAEAFVCQGKVHVYAVVKTTFRRLGEKNSDISYGHRTPSGLTAEQEAVIRAEVEKATRALHITMGSVNFDVILSAEDGKPYIIDCGIRVGQNLIASHMVPLSRGISEMDAYIAQVLGKPADAKPKFEKCIATRLLICEPGVIRKIKPMERLMGTHGIVDIVMRKHVGDVQRIYTDKSDNCGWVLCGGATPDEAEENAERARQLLLEYIITE